MKEQDNPWKTRSSTEIYENNWIRVRQDDVLTPAGKDGIYGVVEFKNLAIGVIPLDEAFNTWIVGQYRYPLDLYSWEIPEGGGPFSEAPEKSALRELKEETGLIANRLTPLLTMHLSNSATTEKAVIFLARDLKEGESAPEETEQLIVRKLPFQELFEMVMQGKVTDSLTVAGVLKLQLMIDRGELV